MEFEKTFENAMEDYDGTRPVYPQELYDDIFAYTHIGEKSDVLEIGIGTGKATAPILRTGCNLVAIEPGERMCQFTKEKYKSHSNFQLYNGTVQEFDCPPGSYDLVYAATSFHWIPEEYGYKRVYDLLKPGGVFARFGYHAGKDKLRLELAEEIQRAYVTYMGVKEEPREYSEEDAQRLALIAPEYGFVDTQCKMYRWTKEFTADEYMKLLRTYPNHVALPSDRRDGLFSAVYHAIKDNGGIITVYYTMDLHLARKIKE